MANPAYRLNPSELASSSLEDIAAIRGMTLVLAAMLHGHPARAQAQAICDKLDILHNDVDVAFEVAGVSA
jgi:hypothetical protein